MKKNKISIITILLGLTLVLSACVAGPRVTGTPGLSISEETAYVAYGNFVYSLDVDSGSVAWSYPSEPSASVVFYAQPLVTDSFIYVGDLANQFHKLNKDTGTALWTFSDANGYFIGKAAENEGVVFAPSNDGSLYAIDENGDLLWAFETQHYLWAQPLIHDETIFMGSMDHSMYALSLAGEERWSVKLSGAIVNAPIISEDGSTLYVSSLGSELVALDTSDGTSIWTFESEESIWGEMVLVESTVFIADSDGNVYAVDASNGAELWKKKVSSAVIGGIAQLEDGIVLATDEGLIKAFDFEGNSLWEATLEGEAYQAPVTNGQILIAGTIEGENLVYGFDVDGVQLWSTTPEN